MHMAQSSSDKSLISNRYEAEKVGAGVEGPIFVWIGGDRGGGAESSAACSHRLRQLVGCE